VNYQKLEVVRSNLKYSRRLFMYNNFKPLPCGKEPPVPSVRRLDAPQTQYGRSSEEENPWSCRESNTGCPAPSHSF